jgi:hypothetical protein
LSAASKQIFLGGGTILVLERTILVLDPVHVETLATSRSCCREEVVIFVGFFKQQIIVITFVSATNCKALIIIASCLDLNASVIRNNQPKKDLGICGKLTFLLDVNHP